MTPIPNPFKARLREPGAQIGLWLALADAYAAEVCAGAGFDWLVVDGEHAPNDLRSILAQLQALAPYPSHPVVRTPVGETWMIKQLLDIGAQTLLVPMVETPEQATALVAATRYPPEGVRGVGAAIARASRFDRQAGYLHAAGSEICLLVQIETRLGLDNLDAIAAIDGVDGLFIGPADLSASMGYLDNPTAPEVQSAIEDALRRIGASGKAAGILMGDEALARRYIELGARFVAVGTDIGLLSRNAGALAARYGAGPEAHGSGTADTGARTY
ncbi:4-hydroxy-2-oxoheptanedioate aldolase [Lichenicoccus roseus]|uniref:4-hydroxy-2-oxoheptanedioate aldolase n=1 Tax=Lichenicoccus roseus TaxID=2683649 RepID=A0A5R9J1J0_9PROT|nr:4-hydroxy-2-oxoheptanedioate aldolase [Lichenicoccus roseus]TLU71504.1 4-hydroxy-2-oxoheptanedioate aldolase [Lichenicoccus roseus]